MHIYVSPYNTLINRNVQQVKQKISAPNCVGFLMLFSIYLTLYEIDVNLITSIYVVERTIERKSSCRSNHQIVDIIHGKVDLSVLSAKV